ncbi:hypothetical protein A6302_00191 [Methylobrevis pamukkalensis]|uniref:Uncharacterized protein n=1 Tax=Methylobrevis pamukkalensis TaxID=1439726 RepID=A0A1E3H8G2_9HYPH|nr:hypothetical protein A6302_00191 [Methylobrevis pamukkalensis]
MEAVEIRGEVPVRVMREEIAEEPMVEMRPLVVEDGAPVTAADGQPVFHPVPLFETVDEEVEVIERISAGTRFGLRYDQCLVFETAFLRRVADGLEARLGALETICGLDPAR